MHSAGLWLHFRDMTCARMALLCGTMSIIPQRTPDQAGRWLRILATPGRRGRDRLRAGTLCLAIAAGVSDLWRLQLRNSEILSCTTNTVGCTTTDERCESIPTLAQRHF
jgi:hypothetical protein